MKTKPKIITIAISSSILLTSTGCATLEKHSTLIAGCAWGAVLGTVSGAIAGGGDPEKMLIGAGIGLIAGCGTGYYLEKREEALAKKAEESGFKPEFERIQLTEGKGANFDPLAEDDVAASQLTLNTDKPVFDVNKSTVTDKETLARIDAFLTVYVESLDENSKVFVVGHTDSSGSPVYNQKLSEQRALFIANRLSTMGLSKDRIFFEGVGPNQPVASNSTPEGKAKNRRFELIDIFTDDIANNAVSLDTVLAVSNAKKQRIENIMNDQGLAQSAKVKEEKNKVKAEGGDADAPLDLKPILVAASKEPQTQVGVRRDNSPLNLQGADLDFVASSNALTSNLGVYHDDSWSLFAKANAAPPAVIESCAISGPKVQSSVKTLSGQSHTLKVGDGLPSLFGLDWYGAADTESGSNKTMVIVGPVYIDKTDFSPHGDPSIKFITNYSRSKQTPDYIYKAQVETYRGDDAVLYRVYPADGKAKIDCADFVFSTTGETVAKHAEIVYTANRTQRSKQINLKTILPN